VCEHIAIGHLKKREDNRAVLHVNYTRPHVAGTSIGVRVMFGRSKELSNVGDARRVSRWPRHLAPVAWGVHALAVLCGVHPPCAVDPPALHLRGARGDEQRAAPQTRAGCGVCHDVVSAAHTRS